MTGDTYYLQKSNQPCFLFPWSAQAPCPWGPGYVRILIPCHNGDTHRDGSRATVTVVRSTALKKRWNNEALPADSWIPLTR
jgi:hypothetical protein